MTTKERFRVMLVDGNRGRAAPLRQALVDAGQEVVACVSATEDLVERVKEFDPEVIIVDMALPDRGTLEHLRSISRDRPRPVVMFAERSDAATTRAAIGAGVSAYVVDGLSPSRLKSVMDVAIARFREYDAMRRELAETRSQLAERKVVERAKGILMQRKGLSEDEAYKALRKLAMDKNKRIAEIAEGIVAAAELLG